jgi:hypothetical protein
VVSVEVRVLGRKGGGGVEGKEKKRRERRRKGRRKKLWREREVEQYRAKQIVVCANWKKEVGNNKCSGLFPLISNLGVDNFSRVLTVKFSVLKVGIWTAVAIDVAPPYWTTLRVICSGYLSPGFLWWDGISGGGEFSEVLLRGAGI